MSNWDIQGIDIVVGDPIISEKELYSTISEEDENTTSDEKNEGISEDSGSIIEGKSEEEEASKEEATDEVEKVEEEDPSDETSLELENEIQLDPEEASKLSMQTQIVRSVYSDLRNDLPRFRSGDTISIGYRVLEGSRSRVQTFEGVVIKISSGHGLDTTFTVRKISNGVGVERIFPFHSPNIESINVLKEGKVRRAKLYYLRNRKGKAARIKERV